MRTSEQQVLNFVRFVDLSRWSAGSALLKKIKSSYPLLPLSCVLKRIKEPVVLEDEKRYRRITVRLYGQGVIERDELYGKDIGTKRQFIAREGQLIISRIDARNGAFGIVPKDLDGAVVTNDFWLFEVQNAFVQYIVLVLSSEQFQRQWQSQSSGTTNRQRVDEDTFLMSKIPMPTFKEQESLLEEYNNRITLSEEHRAEIYSLRHQIDEYLIEKLHISFKKSSFNGLIGTAHYRAITRWDPQFLLNSVSVDSNEELINLAEIIHHFMEDKAGKSLRINPQNHKEDTFLYIGMEHVEKSTGKADVKEVSGKDILSQTLRVPDDYIIYGKLRPYLNKYWINKDSLNNVICSSEFFVFNTQGINKRFFVEVLSSQIIQEQLVPLYSGARMPRINERDFLNLRIPLPNEHKQTEIVDHITLIRKRIECLEAQIIFNRKSAKREFEEAVFGEA